MIKIYEMKSLDLEEIMALQKSPLLNVKKLNIKSNGGGDGIVRSLSFSVGAGEIVGIAGESGSGKSMTALSIMGLLPQDMVWDAEEVSLEGERLCKKTEQEYEKLRGNEIAMIFQEPMTSLNPVQKIGKQVEEPLLLHGAFSKEERKSAALEAMREAGLQNAEELLERYSHELSGGQRQRVMIAMAMIGKPKLLIADEPTTALDAKTEEQILSLLKTLSQTHNMAVLFISHNLHAVRQLCERVLIMKDGELVEEGSTETIFTQPKEDYTKRLLASIPTGEKPEEEKQVRGEMLLEVEHLSVYYRQAIGKNLMRNFFGKKKFKTKESEDVTPGFGKQPKQQKKPFDFVQKQENIKTNRKQVIFDSSFSIYEGEIVGLVGESGNGKTTLIKTIAGFHELYDGVIRWNPKGVKMQMVFQDPYSSLNPAKKIGWLLEEPLRLQTKLKAAERKQQALQMLAEVELPAEYYDRYISELSGGQRQRVAIAVALIQKPQLVLLDEPVSALDVTVQAQILALLLRLQKEHRLTYLFISHDQNVIRRLCDRVLEMQNGTIISS